MNLAQRSTDERIADALKAPKADIVGWSDGAILGLDLAIRQPARVGKIFAVAANTVTSGVKDGVEKNPTFAAFIEPAGLLILPNASHFAFLQDPEFFNYAVLHFLGDH